MPPDFVTVNKLGAETPSKRTDREDQKRLIKLQDARSLSIYGRKAIRARQTTSVHEE